MAGWLPLFAASSGFNGGKSQINLNFPTANENAFANVCLYGSQWQYVSGPNINTRLRADEIDANGMPTVLSSGTVTASSDIPPTLARPGNYVIRTTGSGTVSATGVGTPLATGSFTGVLVSGVLSVSGLTGSIIKGQALLGTGVTAGSCIGAQLSGTTYQINNYLTGAASTQSLASVSMTTGNGSLTVSGTGRYIYYPGDRGFIGGGISYYITAIGSPAITQYAIVHVDDEMGWVLDPFMFNPQFKSALRNAKFGVIRNLNWLQTNVSNVTTWATRKPTTYFSFGFDEARPSLFAGNATHATGTSVAISSITSALANITGSVSGSTLTVASVLSGTIAVGASLFNGGVPQGTVIISNLGGGQWGLNRTLGTAIGAGTFMQTACATVVTSSAHGKTGTLPIGIQTTYSGDPGFNGQFQGTVVNTTTITYPMQGCDQTPVTPSALGTIKFGVYDYATSFNDPTYGNGAPVDKQTYHVYFDWMSCVDFNTEVSFTGTKTCNWAGHTFSGGEMIAFDKYGRPSTDQIPNTNLPDNVGQGITYYVLPTNLVAGTSFEFSLTSGGSAVTFTAVGGTQTGVRLLTINQNSTGRVPILSQDARPTYPDAVRLGNAPSPNQRYGQHTLGTLVYDAQLKAFLLCGGSLAGDCGIVNAVPPEIFVKLCKEVGAYSWHCLPVMALDPQTDYVPQMYNLARSNTTWDKPRFENANEIWNSAFMTTQYARAKAFANFNAEFGGGNFNEGQWMGKVNSTTGQILKQMAGSVGNNYEMIAGTQTSNFASVGDGGMAVRIGAANYVNTVAAAQTLSVPALSFSISFTKATANKYITRACLANYIVSSNYTGFNTTTFLANFAWFRASISAGVMTVTSFGLNGVNAGTLKTGQTIKDFYGQIPGGVTITGGTGPYTISNSSISVIECYMMASNSTSDAEVGSFLNGLNGVSAPFNNAWVVAAFTNCKNYLQSISNNDAGVKIGQMPYEGGYGVDYNSGAALALLWQAAKFSPYLGIALVNGGTMADSSSINGLYKDLVALGVDFPSAFTMGSTNNSWSIMDPDIYNATLPSYTAISAFNV